ncbi:L,D-transpeptidase scaffold domain-containing protein [Hymenobacter latericus]|uniref:L,D-transpeptidase family protein n=1 Tax=Hymenobacter sp. YIM 151858-1 TaxID=2987688 RepID=UPI002227780E|nr:L,D-transpeptidase family protein [Hymenobacter sp. YIM 151858-1]UYZ60277.1 L,D-transpeptidase family protein [Hymenobacter sp. YIM 151858-1]
MPAALHGEVLRFYTGVGFAPSWTSEKGLLPAAADGVKLLHRAAEFGLNPADYKVQDLAANLDSLAVAGSPEARLQRRVAAELHLTSALLKLASHLRRGRLQPATLQPATCEPDSVFDGADWLLRARRSAQLGQQLLRLQPTTRSYVRLQWAWQKLVRTDTAAARKLSGPVAVNLERLRWEPRGDSAYLLVNIPAYTLQIVRGPAVVRSFRVIVGGVPTPTPEVYSHVRFFQTSPEWKVPRSIALNEILPRLRRNPAFLAANNYVLYNQQGQQISPHKVNWKQITPETFRYSIRQAACCDNALGNVVFRFPNAHDIFVHDTPARKLFSAPRRALSHGCIRLEKPFQLAAFLLRRDYGEQAPRHIERMWDSVYGGYSKYFPLRNPMPIYIRYLTCHADNGPTLQTLPDVYQRDAPVLQALQQASQESTAAAAR